MCLVVFPKQKNEKDLEFLLLICKSFKSQPKKTKKVKKKKLQADKEQELHFSNVEDEEFLKVKY